MTDGSAIAKAHSAGPAAKAIDSGKKAKLQKAVKEFESVFVGYILKTMRGTIPKSDLAGDDFGGDVLEGMFDSEMAKQISSRSGFGLGEMMYRQLTGESLPGHGSHSGGVGIPPALLMQGQSAPSDTVSERIGNFNDAIKRAATDNALSPSLLKAVIAAESGGNPSARSAKNAKGLMQLLDTTATDMGIKDVWNPQENIQGGAKYLKQMMERFGGDLTKALASYNAGPSAVEKHNGIPPFKETREYVKKVIDFMDAFDNEEADK
jgi:Rod binding domain-containing protein